MVDARYHQHGRLGQEAEHGHVHAVGWRAVDREPVLAHLQRPERPVQGQRVAAGALLALRGDDVDLSELGERFLERCEPRSVNTVIVGEDYDGHMVVRVVVRAAGRRGAGAPPAEAQL